MVSVVLLLDVKLLTSTTMHLSVIRRSDDDDILVLISNELKIHNQSSKKF